MDTPLQPEFNYYLKHQKELVGKHAGKFIVIKGQQVIGAYDTQEQAYVEARKRFELGDFLIQFVSPGEQSYTQTFHSRVG